MSRSNPYIPIDLFFTLSEKIGEIWGTHSNLTIARDRLSGESVVDPSEIALRIRGLRSEANWLRRIAADLDVLADKASSSP